MANRRGHITGIMLIGLVLALLPARAQDADDKAAIIHMEALQVVREKAAPVTPPPPVLSAINPPSLLPKVEPNAALFFVGTSERLTDDSWLVLQSMAESLTERPVRIALQAYGGTPGTDVADARRIALRRGVAVRRYFLEQGMAEARIMLHVEGIAQTDTPGHRIDLFLATE